MGKLDGKVALITSIDDGIGLAAAKELVNEGAYLFITGRRTPELITATKNLGSKVRNIQVDMENFANLDRLFAQIRQQKGRLDIIFSNTDVTAEDDNSILDTNVKGLFFVTHRALPLMTSGASIILNASFFPKNVWRSNLVLAAAAAAIRSFGRTLAVELFDRRIRVNVVSRNYRGTATPNHSSEKNSEAVELSKMKSNGVSVSRPNTAAEVAEGVMFLLDKDREISGSELFMHGGEAHLRRFSEVMSPGEPGTLDEMAQNIRYLASDESRHLSGIELFADRETADL
jgi:NAD(P)-dependent dehydrogenase (short-subunit alcohol dehydrogenase family)